MLPPPAASSVPSVLNATLATGGAEAVARWDGLAWRALDGPFGAGVDSPPGAGVSPGVDALAVYDGDVLTV